MKVTAQELHEHIQATIFGRRGDVAKRRQFDNLQAILHELVDRPSDVDVIRAFVARVERRAKQYGAEADGSDTCWPAIMDELFEFEEQARAEE